MVLNAAVNQRITDTGVEVHVSLTKTVPLNLALSLKRYGCFMKEGLSRLLLHKKETTNTPNHLVVPNKVFEKSTFRLNIMLAMTF